MGSLFIISTSLCAFSYLIPFVIKYVVGWLFSESAQESNIRKEMLRLEQEMSSISMVDEFAKYTKIQRRHTKLREDFKNQCSERMSSRAKTQLIATYAARFLNGIVMLILMKLYRSEPIIILPKGTLWPLDNFFSWPSAYEDSISLAMWMAITTIVSSYKDI